MSADSDSDRHLTGTGALQVWLTCPQLRWHGSIQGSPLPLSPLVTRSPFGAVTHLYTMLPSATGSTQLTRSLPLPALPRSPGTAAAGPTPREAHARPTRHCRFPASPVRLASLIRAQPA